MLETKLSRYYLLFFSLDLVVLCRPKSFIKKMLENEMKYDYAGPQKYRCNIESRRCGL